MTHRFVAFYAKYIPCACAVMLTLCTLSAPVYSAAPSAGPKVNQAELKNALSQIFRENPELILNVLRENSVEVLEIAQQGSQERQFKTMRAQWQQDLKTPPRELTHDRPILGNPKAPVTIIAYSDYTCPFCANASAVIDQVLAARKDSVRFIFKNFPKSNPVNPLPRLAAEYVTAAFMQDEAKAWAYHRDIFENQERFMGEGEGFLRTAALAQGFNLQKLSADMKSKKVRTVIEEDIAEATQQRVPGTPFHFVNSLSVRGSIPLPYFLEAVDLALKNTQEK